MSTDADNPDDVREHRAAVDSPPLRSSGWLALDGKQGFTHRAWLRAEGLPDDAFTGRPIIGIANSASELAPCNRHLTALAEHVKRGVWQAGGVPLEFPVMGLGETLMRPSTMMYRNLLAMETEELIRANPERMIRYLETSFVPLRTFDSIADLQQQADRWTGDDRRRPVCPPVRWDSPGRARR